MNEVQPGIFSLVNRNGAEARITNYGGIVMSLTMPDRDGVFADVVLGYDTVAEYIAFNPCFGALVGRYANRIRNAQFTLEGRSYRLTMRKPPHCLHGGLKGFDKVLWSARPAQTGDGPALVLTRRSPDGEEGFPGNLDVTATYTLTHDNALRVEFVATTDAPTVVNLTHHSYFNLAGVSSGEILGHEVTIPADRFTPVDEGLIPTGELAPVEGTPLDFRAPRAIGERIADVHPQLAAAGGYDHNWVINKPYGAWGLVGRAVERGSGRCLDVYSDQPGVQFYSGNFLDGRAVGKGGVSYTSRTGFCFEPQHYPDSPNQPAFPSTVLRPGEVFRKTMDYRFSVME